MSETIRHSIVSDSRETQNKWSVKAFTRIVNHHIGSFVELKEINIIRTSVYIFVYYTKYTLSTRKSILSLNPTHYYNAGGNNLFNAQINGYKRFLKVRKH